MSPARPKSELLSELAESRKGEGLAKTVVWIPAEERERLASFVRDELGGIYNPKPPRDAQVPAGHGDGGDGTEPTDGAVRSP